MLLRTDSWSWVIDWYIARCNGDMSHLFRECRMIITTSQMAQNRERIRTHTHTHTQIATQLDVLNDLWWQIGEHVALASSLGVCTRKISTMEDRNAFDVRG
jgi:hypothetical protein